MDESSVIQLIEKFYNPDENSRIEAMNAVISLQEDRNFILTLINIILKNESTKNTLGCINLLNTNEHLFNVVGPIEILDSFSEFIAQLQKNSSAILNSISKLLPKSIIVSKDHLNHFFVRYSDPNFISWCLANTIEMVMRMDDRVGIDYIIESIDVFNNKFQETLKIIFDTYSGDEKVDEGSATTIKQIIEAYENLCCISDFDFSQSFSELYAFINKSRIYEPWFSQFSKFTNSFSNCETIFKFSLDVLLQIDIEDKKLIDQTISNLVNTVKSGLPYFGDEIHEIKTEILQKALFLSFYTEYDYDKLNNDLSFFLQTEIENDPENEPIIESCIALITEMVQTQEDVNSVLDFITDDAMKFKFANAFEIEQIPEEFHQLQQEKIYSNVFNGCLIQFYANNSSIDIFDALCIDLREIDINIQIRLSVYILKASENKPEILQNSILNFVEILFDDLIQLIDNNISEDVVCFIIEKLNNLLNNFKLYPTEEEFYGRLLVLLHKINYPQIIDDFAEITCKIARNVTDININPGFVLEFFNFVNSLLPENFEFGMIYLANICSVIEFFFYEEVRLIYTNTFCPLLHENSSNISHLIQICSFNSDVNNLFNIYISSNIDLSKNNYYGSVVYHLLINNVIALEDVKNKFKDIMIPFMLAYLIGRDQITFYLSLGDDFLIDEILNTFRNGTPFKIIDEMIFIAFLFKYRFIAKIDSELYMRAFAYNNKFAALKENANNIHFAFQRLQKLHDSSNDLEKNKWSSSYFARNDLPVADFIYRYLKEKMHKFYHDRLQQLKIALDLPDILMGYQ